MIICDHCEGRGQVTAIEVTVKSEAAAVLKVGRSLVLCDRCVEHLVKGVQAVLDPPVGGC